MIPEKDRLPCTGIEANEAKPSSDKRRKIKEALNALFLDLITVSCKGFRLEAEPLRLLVDLPLESNLRSSS